MDVKDSSKAVYLESVLRIRDILALCAEVSIPYFIKQFIA